MMRKCWPLRASLLAAVWDLGSARGVAAQNPTVALPSGSSYTYFSLAASAATPLAPTQFVTTNGQIVSPPGNAFTVQPTNIPCQAPFNEGLVPNFNANSPEIKLTSATAVTGSNVAMWVFLRDFSYPSGAVEFMSRDLAGTASGNFDFRMGLLATSGSLAVDGANVFCVGQGVMTTASTNNSPVNACIGPNLIPLQTWVHVGVKMTRNNSVYPRIYINGVLQTNVFQAGAIVNGPSFTSNSVGFYLGGSYTGTNLMNGHIRNVFTSAGVFTDADFAYLGNQNNVVKTSTVCDPNTYCPAKGNTRANCFTLRSQCHYNETVSTCQGSAPASCAQFVDDTVGCAAQPNCVIQGYNGNRCATKCSLLSPQDCVGSFPARQECRLNYTSSPQQCYASTANVDGCAGSANSTTCNSTACFFDPYELNCFTSLNQANSVFNCKFWSDMYSSSSGACQYHGCVLSPSGLCIQAVATGNTADNSTSINYSRLIQFLNPQVLPSSQIFQVTVAVPFASSSRPDTAWPLSPAWPTISVLFPVTSIGSYVRTFRPSCNTYSGLRTDDPVLLLPSQSPNVAALQNFIISSVASTKTLQFNESSALGLAASNLYGQPLSNSTSLVTQVTIDSAASLVLFTVQTDLVLAVQQCAAWGASLQTTPSGRIFTLPLSYEEENPQKAYTQFTQIYTVNIPNTGTATIGVTTNYRTSAFPLETVFPTQTCAANSAAMRTTWQLEFNNVYDSTRQIGPRSITDVVIRSPASPVGPNNCFGDSVVGFQFLGCDSTQFKCSYLITVQSKCRALTSDGNAFGPCSYASAADRISDMGSDVPYPARLDRYHEFWYYTYNCPASRANDAACSIITSSSFNLPDFASGLIFASQYLTATAQANPFAVQVGVLPTPTSQLSALAVVQGVGAASPLRQFDGNVFTQQPLTVVALLPAALQQLYDLRIRINFSNFSLISLDPFGAPLANNASLSFPSFKNFLLHTVKNDYDNGCGATQRCFLLPACQGVLGCDGFSISLPLLRQLQVGNGYRFSLNYAIGLTNVDGSAPSARSLQQASSNSTTTTHYGQLALDFNVTTPEEVARQQYDSFVAQCQAAFAKDSPEPSDFAAFSALGVAAAWVVMYSLTCSLAFGLTLSGQATPLEGRRERWQD